MTFFTIESIRDANEAIGHHWFDRGTLRFFKSRIGHHVYGGHFFTSSEKGPDGIRAYSVRCALESGEIQTVGPFQHYNTSREARKDAQFLAEIGVVPFRESDSGALAFRLPDGRTCRRNPESRKWQIGLVTANTPALAIILVA